MTDLLFRWNNSDQVMITHRGRMRCGFPQRSTRKFAGRGTDRHNGAVAQDPYLWLEDITGDDALDWVRKHNEPTLAAFGGTRFEQMRTEALEVLDTEARIPYVRRRG